MLSQKSIDTDFVAYNFEVLHGNKVFVINSRWLYNNVVDAISFSTDINHKKLRLLWKQVIHD